MVPCCLGEGPVTSRLVRFLFSRSRRIWRVGPRFGIVKPTGDTSACKGSGGAKERHRSLTRILLTDARTRLSKFDAIGESDLQIRHC